MRNLTEIFAIRMSVLAVGTMLYFTLLKNQLGFQTYSYFGMIAYFGFVFGWLLVFRKDLQILKLERMKFSLKRILEEFR